MLLRQYVEQSKSKSRQSLSKEKRIAKWSRANGKCWYCGEDVPKTAFVLDHTEPRSRGGSNAQFNLVVSCWTCDREKGAMNLDEFRAHRNVLQFHGEKPKRIELPKRVKVPKPPLIPVRKRFPKPLDTGKRERAIAAAIRLREAKSVIYAKTFNGLLEQYNEAIIEAPDWQTTRELMRARYSLIMED